LISADTPPFFSERFDNFGSPNALFTGRFPNFKDIPTIVFTAFILFLTINHRE
jgi:hypothetical protein